MLFYDVDLARINAKYREEKMIRQMQDVNADIAYVTGLLQKIASSVSHWVQPKAKQETNRPIGGIQTNLR